MFERMIQPLLVHCLQPHLHEFQFGFRHERGTYDNLLLLQKHVTSVLHSPRDPKSEPARLPVAFMDLSKAFDKVHINSLLYKLSKMGVTGRLWSFCKSFLSGRRLRTIEGQSCSAWYPTYCGVPQGTVLGPILFLAYINDLAVSISTHSCIPACFADDLAIIPLITPQRRPVPGFGYNQNPLAVPVPPPPDPGPYPQSPSDLLLQRALHECDSWAKQWRMSFSREKTNVVVFRRPCLRRADRWSSDRAVPFDLPLAGFALSFVSSYTYVGLVWSEDGSWTRQATYLTNKLNRTSHLISRMINTSTPPSIVRTLVNSVLRPALTYALPFWRPTPAMFTKLNSLLARSLRHCLSLPTGTHTLAVLAEFGIPSVKVMQEYLCLRTTIRAINMPAHNPTRSLFSSSILAPVPFTGSDGDLPLPRLACAILRSGHWGPVTTRSLVDSAFLLSPLLWSSDPAAIKPDVWLSALCGTRAVSYWKKQVSAANRNTQSTNTSNSGSAWLASTYASPTFTIQPYLHHDKPEVARLRARFRFARVLTNERLQLTRQRDSSKCNTCPTLTETTIHVLLTCSAYTTARLRLVHRLGLLAPPSTFTSSAPENLILGQVASFTFSLVPRLLSISGSFLLSIARSRADPNF